MEEAARADIVHNHGLWMWPNAYAREAAVAAGKPLVISPRGMLEAWSLGRSRLRKAVAWRLFEKRNLQSAAMFHATAESEAESIRQVILPLLEGGKVRKCEREVPIVVAPNGVDLPDLGRGTGRETIEEKFPELKGRRWVVFMSRLHPKKGIDLLLCAWARQKEVASDVWREPETAVAVVDSARRSRGQTKDLPVLVLAGSDLIGYRKEIDKMVRELGVQDSVVIAGEVQGKMKDALLANADLFVLPSYSENFGIVVAEAMAWGRPVIATTGTPWKEVVDVGAGWWVKPEEEALAKALAEALGKRAQELEAMGLRGRALVKRGYTWAAPAERLTKAYEQILATDRHG
jgi:glycosyltransferase involved in cell wall biosynthesis